MHLEKDYVYLPGHLTFEEIPAKYNAVAWYFNGELIDLNWKGAEDIRNKLKGYYGYKAIAKQ
jgi:hypothetical protein